MENAVVFVGEPITYRMEGGMVRFEIRTGGKELKFAMSANNFLAGFLRAGAIARQWRGGEVVSIDRAVG